MDAPHTRRARQRVETIAAIKDEARRQLGEVGAGGLSLRAVARHQGMVSSAIYRYFESRDALLTALIIDAYDAMGDAVERAVAAHPRASVARRWRDGCLALRSWARSHPHEWALVYGSPVPGYAAPVDTNQPGSRVPVVLLGLVAEAERSGTLTGAGLQSMPVGVTLTRQAGAVAREVGIEVRPERAVAAALAWTQILGHISLELFGQFANTFDPADALFDHAVAASSAIIGFR